MNQFPLDPFRILLVEDESLIAMFLEGVLEDAGYEVVGPACRIETAVDLARDEEVLDAAVLDVNLGRTTVFPVADELARRSIPFIFMTGYGLAGLPDHYRDRPVLTKPYTHDMVVDALTKVISPRQAKLAVAS